MRQTLVSALRRAKQLGVCGGPVAVGSHDFVLSAKSREDEWWLLENRDFALTIDERGYLDGWRLTVEVRALVLAALGPRHSVRLAEEIATDLLHVVEGERVGRLDVCADVTGLDLGAVDNEQWVTSGRAKAEKRYPGEPKWEFHLGGERIAFYVGKGDIVLRCYDKTCELGTDVDGEKRATEHARWKEAGWNGEDLVVRVEFQVRGDALKELDDGRLRDPSTFCERLDAAWKYFTCKWVRLCIMHSASRRTNWRTDPAWTIIQGVSFGNDTGELATRTRSRGAPSATVVLGHALSYAARAGQLEGVALPTDATLERWTEADAKEFVRSKLSYMLGIIGDQIAHAVIDALGPARAARVLVEKLRAARAKASSVVPLAEPPAFDFGELFGTAA